MKVKGNCKQGRWTCKHFSKGRKGWDCCNLTGKWIRETTLCTIAGDRKHVQRSIEILEDENLEKLSKEQLVHIIATSAPATKHELVMGFRRNLNAQKNDPMACFECRMIAKTLKV